jgi:hypothetical protein
MQQLELQYFWSLTEQIPLELDYSDCAKPQLSITSTNGIQSGSYFNSNGGTTSYSLVASTLNIDVDTTIVKVNEKPNIFRRGLYKALGLKWEKK